MEIMWRAVVDLKFTNLAALFFNQSINLKGIYACTYNDISDQILVFLLMNDLSLNEYSKLFFKTCSLIRLRISMSNFL